jgi:hypothetical protein
VVDPAKSYLDRRSYQVVARFWLQNTIRLSDLNPNSKDVRDVDWSEEEDRKGVAEARRGIELPLEIEWV